MNPFLKSSLFTTTTTVTTMSTTATTTSSTQQLLRKFFSTICISCSSSVISSSTSSSSSFSSLYYISSSPSTSSIIRSSRFPLYSRSFSTQSDTTTPTTDSSESRWKTKSKTKTTAVKKLNKRFFGPPPKLPRENLDDMLEQLENVSLDDPEIKALGLDEEKIKQLTAILNSGKHPAKLGFKRPSGYSIDKNNGTPPVNPEEENFYDPILSHMTPEDIQARYEKMSQEELQEEFERQQQVRLQHEAKMRQEHEALLNQPLGRLPTREELIAMIDSMFAMKVRDRLLYPPYSHYEIKKQLIEKMKVHFKNWKADDVEYTPRRVYWALFSNMASIGSKVLKTEDERISILCPEAPFVGEAVPFPQFPEVPITHKRYFTTSKKPPPADVAISDEVDISANEVKPFYDPATAHTEAHVDKNNRPIRYALAKDGGIHQLAIQYKFRSSNKLMEIRYRLCADDVERLGLFASPTARINNEDMARTPIKHSIFQPNPNFTDLPKAEPRGSFLYARSPQEQAETVSMTQATKLVELLRKRARARN